MCGFERGDEAVRKDNKDGIGETKTAVALRYDANQEAAPRVVATGRGDLARRILTVAGSHGIPVHEDPTLAQLLAKLELGTEIPAELYQVVAEVLAFVYRLNRQVGEGSSETDPFGSLGGTGGPGLSAK